MFRALIPAAVAVATLSATAQAGEVWVSIDTMTRYQLPDAVGQVILTNPGVADVQVGSATEIFIFGRVPGFTDVIFQTAEGRRIGQVRVRVENEQSGLVTLYKGGERFSFSCTTRCERSLTIGDGVLATSDAIAQQAQVKQALGANTSSLVGQGVEVQRETSADAEPANRPIPPGS